MGGMGAVGSTDRADGSTSGGARGSTSGSTSGTSGESLRTTLPTGQQLTPVFGAVVSLAVAALSAFVGSPGMALVLTLIAVALLTLYALVMFGSYSVLDATGVHSRRGVFRNHATWDEVEDIRLDPKSGECLVVYRRDGRPFKLGAPISGGMSTDPGYRARVTAVLEFAAAHRE